MTLQAKTNRQQRRLYLPIIGTAATLWPLRTSPQLPATFSSLSQSRPFRSLKFPTPWSPIRDGAAPVLLPVEPNLLT